MHLFSGLFEKKNFFYFKYPEKYSNLAEHSLIYIPLDSLPFWSMVDTCLNNWEVLKIKITILLSLQILKKCGLPGTETDSEPRIVSMLWEGVVLLLGLSFLPSARSWPSLWSGWFSLHSFSRRCMCLNPSLQVLLPTSLGSLVRGCSVGPVGQS